MSKYGYRVVLGLLVVFFTNTVFAYTSTNIYTPNGSRVTVRIYDELPASELAELEAEVSADWPGAVIISPATARYNCHSFAFYKHYSTNTYWLNDPRKYWEDGSYVKLPSGRAIDILEVLDPIVYWENDTIMHAALWNGDKPSNDWTAVSKWARYPLMLHHWLYTPYVFETDADVDDWNVIPGVKVFGYRLAQ
ncbi:MAG: hypothetical protein MI864_14980 [Pseudomonadales bacterium]|nr:hypothetical protein [Pseudomonadales bacterium]